MGNRAVITFDEKPTKNSVGIYLHWNGGPESVLAFIEAAKQLGVRDCSDPAYCRARVVQIIANYFGGTTSVGVATLDELDCDNGNNGVYAVSWNKGEIAIKQSPNGENGWSDVDLEKTRKHPYWQPDKGKKSIVDDILEKNKAAFTKE